MILESTATALKTEKRMHSISKEQSLKVYIPLSMGYLQGQVPAVEDYYDDGRPGVEDIRDTLLDRWWPVYEAEIVSKYGDDSAKLKQHLEWTAQCLGVEGEIPELDAVKMYNVWTELLWRIIGPKLRNPGLFQLVLDADAATDSLAFWTFLIAVPSGAAIEAAYGFFLDIFGIYRRAALSDALLLWTSLYNPDAYDAGFGYQVFRDDYTAARICRPSITGQKVVIFGGGWIPELHFPKVIGENLDLLETYNIYVYDNDPKIDPEFIVGHLDRALQRAVTYSKKDILTGLTEQLQTNAGQIDIIVLKGVASFMLDSFPKFFMAAMQLLKPGGRLIVDFQLKHFTMVRNACMVGWGGGDSKVKIELMDEQGVRDFMDGTLKTAATALGYAADEKFNWGDYIQSTEDDVNDPVGLIYTIKHPR